MTIEILQLLEGARQAKGLTVVIDVFRAFSLECYAFANGAKQILAVADINLAYDLKKQHQDYVLIGERNERIPEGFDFGNSPAHIEKVDFTGKTIIHTTSAGTQGLVNASGATERLTGSFVNASAIVQYIKQQKPDDVSLVCMGYAAKRPSDEDTFCAEYIRNLLEGKPINLQQMVDKLKVTTGARLFAPENQAHSPERDFYLCTHADAFPFVLKASEDIENKGVMKIEKMLI